MQSSIKNIKSFSVRNLHGTAATVIGAARSGVGVAKLLSSVGADVFVSDNGEEKKLRQYLSELERFSIPYEIGVHSDRIYNAELIIVSPGVPSNAPVVLEALKRGIPVVSELEVASWFCSVPIIAVTGTNGKTTTATLVGRMFHDAGRQHIVAGNIGDAFSNHAAILNSNSVAVVEVSSFQLDYIESFRPKVAVILNISADHLNRYGNSLDSYIASKERVFMNQKADDVLIYNNDDAVVSEMVKSASSRKIPFSLKNIVEEGAYLEDDTLTVSLSGRRHHIIRRDEMLLPGLHNLANAMAASLAAIYFGVNTESLRKTLSTFRGVEHRLEFVREIKGIQFVNDSKATNVESTQQALQSFNRRLILILGGRDKGNDYSRINDLVKERVRAIVAIGESAGKVREHFRNIVPVERAGSMKETILKSLALAKPDDIVLFSPACASFDWFENYEHRGQMFKKWVEQFAEQL